MKKWKKVVGFVLAATMTIGMTAGCGGNADSTAEGGGTTAATKTIKFSIGENEDTFLYESAMKFKEVVEAESQGTLAVEVYPSGSLGNDREVLEALQLGQVEMVAPSPAVLANFTPEFNFLTFPFVFPSQEVADAVATGDFGKKMLSLCEEQGFKGLAIADFGFRHVTNSKHPIETVDDFKGLKIRTMENKVHLDSFRALGANPTAMGWSEVFTGLQQGTIDGQENPFTSIYAYKIHEVQPYITETAHVYDWVVFVMSKTFYDSLTPEEQDLVMRAAEEARMLCAQSVAEDDAAAKDAINASGVSAVNEITPEAREEMEAAVDPVRIQYAKEINLELYEEMMAAVAAEESK